MVPLQRLNSIVVFAVDPAAFTEIDRWLLMLDIPPDQGAGRQTFVYNVENAKAADLAAVLNELFGGGEGGQGGRGRHRDAPAAPGCSAPAARRAPDGEGSAPGEASAAWEPAAALPGPGFAAAASPEAAGGLRSAAPANAIGSSSGSSGVGSGSGAQFGGSGGGSSGFGGGQGGGRTGQGLGRGNAAGGAAGGAPGQPAEASPVSRFPAGRPQRPGRRGRAQGPLPVFRQEVRIVADEVTNSLVVLATKRDYQLILDVLRKIDVVPRQVVLEVMIAEVDAQQGPRVRRSPTRSQSGQLEGCGRHGQHAPQHLRQPRAGEHRRAVR